MEAADRGQWLVVATAVVQSTFQENNSPEDSPPLRVSAAFTLDIPDPSRAIRKRSDAPARPQGVHLLGYTSNDPGGLVFKAHRLCVSLNSRLKSNKEEEKSNDPQTLNPNASELK